jgi:uncharacterized protein (DUF934 family)
MREMSFVDPASDPWREVPADDRVVAAPRVERHRLLSPVQWQAVKGAWPADVPIGLVLPNDADVETVADDVSRFAMIALRFPKWVDGRAYSQARLLRARLRYRGEIRATGEVLADMLPLLERTGFDAVALRPDQSQAVAERALAFFPNGHYQADVNEPRPLFARAGRAP